jgi:tRNA(fMet)-specific endonuclease VapC
VSQYILDTDHLTLLLQNHPAVVRRVAAIDPKDIAVTVVTAEEQLYGRLNGIRRASQAAQADRLVLAYTRLKELLEDLKSFQIINFDEDAHTRFVELRRQGIRIGTQDLRIAAIALSRNSIVLTRNRRDFEQVPGLRFEDWTV